MPDQPAGFVPDGFVPDAPPPAAAGYWEDRGMAGSVWHAPGVPAGTDPTARRADAAMISGLPVIGSLAPEDALLAYSGVKAVKGAIAPALGAVGKMLAGVRASLPYATPVVKYEVTKTVLEHAGVPSSVAAVLAMGAAGYQRGGRAAIPPSAAEAEAGAATRVATTAPPDPAAAAAPAPPAAGPAPALPSSPGLLTAAERATYAKQGYSPAHIDQIEQTLQRRAATAAPAAPPAAAPAAPPASAPVAPAPLAAAAPPLSGPTSPPPSGAPADLPKPPMWLRSPQALQNELGIQARRAKLTLTEPQYQQAADLVQAGQSPASAVRAVAPPPKMKVTAAEMKAYTTLRRAGKTDQEARALIQAQKDLAAQLGTPSSEAVRQAIDERNATGRWPDAPEGR